MNDFIRELCESVMPQTYPTYPLPDNVQECIFKRDKIYEKLRKHLKEDDFNMFDEFITLSSCVYHESECYAFSCGMEFTVRTLFGIFSEK